VLGARFVFRFVFRFVVRGSWFARRGSRFVVRSSLPVRLVEPEREHEHDPGSENPDA
jgi:hypothetical protein